MPAVIQDTTQELGFMENTIRFLEDIVMYTTPPAPFGLKHSAKKLHSDEAFKRAHLHVAHNNRFSIN